MSAALPMLIELGRGNPVLPHNKGQCIVATFIGEPHTLKAGAIDAFADQLAMHYDMGFYLAGMEDACLLAYFRPEMYTREIGAYIRSNVTSSAVGEWFTGYDLKKLNIYGRIFSANE